MRGWALLSGIAFYVNNVYPAYAGMDPCLFCAYFKEFSLPRIREGWFLCVVREKKQIKVSPCLSRESALYEFE